MSTWPARSEIVDRLATVAKDYALDQDGIEHPEDIASAMLNAIEVAWRTIEPVQ